MGPTGSPPTLAPRTSTGTPSTEPCMGPGCQLLWLCPREALGLRGWGMRRKPSACELCPSVKWGETCRRAWARSHREAGLQALRGLSHRPHSPRAAEPKGPKNQVTPRGSFSLC